MTMVSPPPPPLPPRPPPGPQGHHGSQSSRTFNHPGIAQGEQSGQSNASRQIHHAQQPATRHGEQPSFSPQVRSFPPPPLPASAMASFASSAVGMAAPHSNASTYQASFPPPPPPPTPFPPATNHATTAMSQHAPHMAPQSYHPPPLFQSTNDGSSTRYPALPSLRVNFSNPNQAAFVAGHGQGNNRVHHQHLPPPPPALNPAASGATGAAPPSPHTHGYQTPQTNHDRTTTPGHPPPLYSSTTQSTQGRPPYPHPPPPPPPPSHLRTMGETQQYLHAPTLHHQPHPPPPPPQQYGPPRAPQGGGGGAPPVAHGPPPPHLQGRCPYPAAPMQHAAARPAPPLPQPPPPPSTHQDRPRIDPAQIPRPPLFTRPQSDQIPVYYPRAFGVDGATAPQLPPAANSRFLVVDDGCASPQLIRSTLYHFPQNRAIWHETGDVPLAVLCTPLAVHASDFVPRPRVVPSGGDVDCGDTCEFRTEEWRDPQSIPLVPEAEDGVGPARCSHCSAYVNPFFGLDGKCNFCGSTTRNLDLSGIPMQFGTCEYEVSGPYITRSLPVLPVHVYALDLTCPNLEKYLPILEKLGTDMAQHFWRQGGGYGMTSNGNDDRNTPMEETKPRMGICFVASAGIFIRQPGPGNCPEGQPYVVMSDVTEDPFCPLPLQDWTFDLSTQEGLESWQIFVRDELVVDIATLRKQARETNVYGRDGLELSCGGAALAFLADALSFTGGRGTLISWRRPNFGMGDVKYREEKVMVGATKNRYSVSTPLQLQQEFLRDTSPDQAATAAFYTNLAADCSKNRISLNIMMHTSSDAATTSFLDMATLGEVCRATCGKLMWVSAQNWQEAFYEELTQQLQSFSGHDAVFKLRCSEGIQVKSYVSNCGTVVDGGLAGSPELDLVSLSPSSCVSVELDHRVGGIPKRSGRVFLQSALLYSTSGRRRVRVSTLAIRTTSIVNEVFRSIDFGATTAFLLRDCVARLHKSQSSEEDREALVTKTRDELYYRCVHILVNYRLHTPAKNSPSGQLILPDKLQLLPLFCMCIVKSPMLRRSMPRRNDGSQAVRLSPSGDERSFYSWHAEQANPVTAMLLAHPAVFSVSNLEGDGKWNPGAEGISGFVRMPPPLLASMECLEDDGCYIVDSGLALYLVIGKDASVDLRENSIQSTTNEAALDPTIKRIVWQIRTFASTERGSESELRPTFAPIVLVVQKENHQAPHETDVLNLMIDDAVGGEKDYSDFLISLHQRIRQRVDTK